jgi:hypothetical protein
VSIVVPVFETEQYLEACLASILGQTFSDFEVIVVDDASTTKGAGSIVRSIGDERVHAVRHDENRGVASARRTGVRRACGEYVAFVDSDDEVDERFLDVMVNSAIRGSADMVECAFQRYEVDGTSWSENRGGERQRLVGDDVRRGMLVGQLSNSMCNKLVRTDLLRACWLDTDQPERRADYAEDLLGLVGVIGLVDCFVHVPDPLYRYRRRPESTTVTADSATIASNIRSLGVVADRVLLEVSRWAQPPDLVQQFLVREFIEPACYLVERYRAAAPVGSTVPLIELGPFGAATAWGILQRAAWEAESQRLHADIDHLKAWIDDRERVIDELKDWIDQLQAAKEFHEEQHLALRLRLGGAP